MFTHGRRTGRFPRHWQGLAVVGLALLAVGATACDGDDNKASAQATIDWDELRIYLEENATDGDLGLHFLADGEPWRRLIIRDPNGKKIVDFRNDNNLEALGSTEIFQESSEPPFSELPRADFLDLFPEGGYTFEGTTLEGDDLFGTYTLSHAQPTEPEITSPDEDEEVDPDDFVVEWLAVPDPTGTGNEIRGYQVVVEQEGDDGAFVFSMDVDAATLSVTVPPEFLLEDQEEYKVEIIAISENGNQTAGEVEFGGLIAP